MRINAVSALKRYMLKRSVLKAMQKVYLRKYSYGTLGVTRSVQHLDIYKESTSLSYSSFLKLLKPRDTRAQEERRERRFPKCVHITQTYEIVLKVTECLWNKPAGCFVSVFP